MIGEHHVITRVLNWQRSAQALDRYEGRAVASL